MNNLDNRLKTKLFISIVSIIVIGGFFGFIWITYGKEIIYITLDKDRLVAFLEKHSVDAPLIFIAIQALQIIFFVLPGEVTQIAGGYLFGTYWGTLYSFIGSLWGTTIAFFIARLTGEAFLEAFVSKDKFEKLKKAINSRKSFVSIFLLFFIPGIPKDLLSYIAGVLPINPIKFILVSTIARIPGIFLSSYSGEMLYNENYTVVAIIGIISVVFLTLTYLYRKKFKIEE